ncbi:hypothetical protein SLGD_02279 [Staphylococcus lugdunensis HKU09-01]|jgi:hypothetical protein|nr:hypothetical protein SLGD_02279 [Staphylococcus lugdunensis HKU09-01]CCB53293.1 hypothetical phage protein [Staphylococcus lugdunensis N920143]DAI76965.1 MAG TPA: hypothetical protein [Caudoviricetes sp.]
MVVMPPHIQQMLFDFALERGYIQKIIEMEQKHESRND